MHRPDMEHAPGEGQPPRFSHEKLRTERTTGLAESRMAWPLAKPLAELLAEPCLARALLESESGGEIFALLRSSMQPSQIRYEVGEHEHPAGLPGMVAASRSPLSRLLGIEVLAMWERLELAAERPADG